MSDPMTALPMTADEQRALAWLQSIKDEAYERGREDARRERVALQERIDYLEAFTGQFFAKGYNSCRHDAIQAIRPLLNKVTHPWATVSDALTAVERLGPSNDAD